jgi:CRP-like cAMP-binding protein
MNLLGNNEERCELQCAMQLIRNVPFFSDLSHDFCRVLAYLCERQIFSVHQLIQREGDMADMAVILVRGTAHILQGGRQITPVAQGSCVGGLALLGQFRWLYSLRAETEVECLLLPRHKFLPQFIAQPDTLGAVARELIGTVVAWEQQQLERPGEMRSYGLATI